MGDPNYKIYNEDIYALNFKKKKKNVSSKAVKKVPCSYWALTWVAVLPTCMTSYEISVRQTRYQTCKDFVKEQCKRLDKAPYVCDRQIKAFFRNSKFYGTCCVASVSGIHHNDFIIDTEITGFH